MAGCHRSNSSANQLWIDIPTLANECPEGHMCAIPELSAEDGLLIAGAIVAVWTLGLIARLFIRAQQQAMRGD